MFCNNFSSKFRVIIFVFNFSLRFISQFGKFHEDFPSKREPCASPSLSVGIGLRTTHIILGKHQAWVGFTLRAFHSLYPFHLSIPFTFLSLSPLYPFHLSIPFTSLSLSLSYLSLPLYISPSTFLFSLSPSLSLLSIILFGVSNGRFRPCSF